MSTRRRSTRTSTTAGDRSLSDGHRDGGYESSGGGSDSYDSGDDPDWPEHSGEDLSPMLAFYYERCRVHHVPPNPHISVALKTQRAELGFSGAFEPRDMIPLGEILEHDKHITYLRLQGCRLSSSVCYMLRDALRKNTTITKLNLSDNKIDKHGGAALGALLAHSKTLKELNLRSNALGEEGAHDLAEGVKGRTAYVDGGGAGRCVMCVMCVCVCVCRVCACVRARLLCYRG
jgi:hypothetical protein